MKVTKNQIDALNLELTMEVAAADYAEIERKKLAERKRNAEFKGFRKGMVPASLIQRVYGEQVLIDSVNQVIAGALDDFIKTEGLNILGEPLSSDKQGEVEWKSGNDFTFVFDMGLSPSFELEVEKTDTVNRYNITPAAATVEKMKDNLRKFKESQKEENITDEGIAAEVDENLKRSLASESEYQFSKDLRQYLVDKAGIELPEAFLKRWLIYANSGKVTEEQVEKEFPAFVKDFKWQLVRGYLMKKWDFKVTEEDLFAAAEGYVRAQYAMYGLSNVPDDMVQEAAHRMLQDGSQVSRLSENVEDQKVLERVKETITVKAKKIGEEKFRELK